MTLKTSCIRNDFYFFSLFELIMTTKNFRFLGKNIHYQISGSGKITLVLLHGFLENLSMWEEYSSRWKNDFQLLAIDLPGHGKTDSLAEVNSTSLMSDAVAAVLGQEKIETAFFIGHSMGGYVALAFGERYREKVKGVLLLNSTALADSETKKGDRERAIKVMQKNPSIFINESIPNLFATDHRVQFENEIKRIIQEALLTSIDGACDCLRGMKEREDKTHLLIENRFPVKFIAGAKDNVIPIDKIREQAQLHPAIELEIFPESGHMSFLEAKEGCYQSICNFISKNA